MGCSSKIFTVRQSRHILDVFINLIIKMKSQLSDNDFYERKINRLEADIATLHE